MKKRGAEGSALSLCKGCSDPFPEQLQKEKVRGIEKVKEIFSAAPPALAAVEQQERCAQQHPRRGDEQREQSREPPYARRAQQIEKRGGERAEKDVFAADGKRRRVETPKRKRRKHVELVEEGSGPVADKIRSSEKITNSELRKALAAFSGGNQDQEG